jgi:hypothetical protein
MSDSTFMWGSTDVKGITATCVYNENHTYTVTASYMHLETKEFKEEETFPATWEPRFGMDIADQAESLVIAEKLALKIEKLAGL